MPPLDPSTLLDHLNAVLDEDAVVALLFQLRLDRARLWPPGVSQQRCLINLIEHFEQRGAYADLLTAVDTFLKRQHLPPLPKPALPGFPPEGQGQGQIIHNLPHRNPAFTGRVELLAQLETDLQGQPSAALTQPHALHGLGGIGKTSLALEYTYRRLADYDLVAWLRAEDPVTLAADLAALAPSLGLSLHNVSDQTLIVGAVLRWLESHARWLLVYDNAPDPATIRPYRPRTGQGHTLITSRHPDWTGDAVSLTVRVLPLAEAVDLLVRRSQAHTAEGADELAQALGCLPLALVQAGAYMAVNGMPIADYLGLFETRRAELWQDEGGPEDYPRSVGATYDLALSDLARHSPRSIDLLSLCAFFAPEGIPLSVIQAGREHLPLDLAQALADPLALNRLLGPLVRYSLLERQGDQLAIHRLVQAVAQDHLSVEEAHTWATTDLTLLADAFPSGDVTRSIEVWPLCARLAPHALAVTAYTARHTLAPTQTIHLLHQLSEYLRTGGQYEDARIAGERAVQLSEATLAPNDPDLATTLNYLGRVLQKEGDFPAARLHYERALTISEKVQGSDHPNTAQFLNDLGTVLHNQGHLSAARSLLERASAIREAALGPDHSDTAQSLANLASLFSAEGDLVKARALLERVLSIDEKFYGFHHTEVATDLNNLAAVLRDQGDFSTARTYCERALAIREKVFGPDHPDTASSLNSLGNVLHDQGDLHTARVYFERALHIQEKTLGPDHPDTAGSLDSLAAVLRAQGDLLTARVYLERALHIQEKTLGPDHPDTASSLNNLAAVLHDQGDLLTARAYFQRVLRVQEKALGPDHPDVASTLNNLGGVFHDQGDFRGARIHLERALSILEKTRGREHPAVGKTLLNLSVVLRRLGQQRAADKAQSRAFRIYQKHHIPVPRVTVTFGRGPHH